MARTKTWVIGGIAACAILGALWLVLRPEERSLRPSTLAATSEPAAAAEKAAELLPAEDVSAARRAEAPTAPAPPRATEAPLRRYVSRAPASEDPLEPVPQRWLTAVFLRADLSPVLEGNVGVELHGLTGGLAQPTLALGPGGRLRVPVRDPLSPLAAWTGVRLTLDVPEHARFDRFFRVEAAPGIYDLGVLVLSAGGAIAGRVRGVEEPRSWMVSILPRDADLPGHVQRGTTDHAFLDETGAFRLEHVPAGRVELTVYHPLLGGVAEEELVVREGATTPFEFRYSGLEPARALFVGVGVGRALKEDELLLADPSGHVLRPTALREGVAIFADLLACPYTLTLAVAGKPPVVKTGLRRGSRASISLPFDELASSFDFPSSAERARQSARERTLGGNGVQVHVVGGESLQLEEVAPGELKLVPMPARPSQHR